jgi:hypothetical protein
MGARRSRKLQTMLTEDGELREVDSSPQIAHETVYCIYCGAPNRATGSYCRQCGQSLDEQTVDDDQPIRYASGVKTKRLTAQNNLSLQNQPRTLSVLVFEVIKLAIVGALVYFIAMPFNNIGQMILAGFILLAWIVVEGFHYGAMTSSDSSSKDKK